MKDLMKKLAAEYLATLDDENDEEYYLTARSLADGEIDSFLDFPPVVAALSAHDQLVQALQLIVIESICPHAVNLAEEALAAAGVKS